MRTLWSPHCGRRCTTRAGRCSSPRRPARAAWWHSSAVTTAWPSPTPWSRGSLRVSAAGCSSGSGRRTRRARWPRRSPRRSSRVARPGRGGGTVDAAALAGRTLFTDPGTRDALARLDRALLEPLRAHDGLAEALRSYLENHGQWEGTAAALGVHRHTARARVARAEELLGVDLRSARVRAELLLALLLGDE
ncbi:helix-turn-helix domain-containing protein [Tsukamurella ocularis]|nr:helix-turn-helix domain-containing protein [Tsukamurella ocularis]